MSFWLHTIVACLSVFIMGVNVAFITNAPDIFPKQTCRFWRLFFIGKTLMTAALTYAIWETHHHTVVKSGFVIVGQVVSLYALWYLYRYKSYAGIVPAREEGC